MVRRERAIELLRIRVSLKITVKPYILMKPLYWTLLLIVWPMMLHGIRKGVHPYKIAPIYYIIHYNVILNFRNMESKNATLRRRPVGACNGL